MTNQPTGRALAEAAARAMGWTERMIEKMRRNLLSSSSSSLKPRSGGRRIDLSLRGGKGRQPPLLEGARYAAALF